MLFFFLIFFFFSSRRRHTRCLSDWSSDVCSSDLRRAARAGDRDHHRRRRRRHPARRAHGRHEPQRDRAHHRAHPPGDGGQDAADGRARHERRLRPRRSHRRARVWRGHRPRHTRAHSRQRCRAGGVSRRAAGRLLMLTISDLHAFYGKSHILQGVSLRVDEGEIVSLLGRNGVGRSTTIKAIMGDVHATGSVSFRNEEICGLPPYVIARKGLGYVPENRDIFPTLTVRQNLLLGVKSMRRAGRWTMDDMFELFPALRQRADNPGGVLSGGEQQMLTICRTLMGNPDLIMIDEPTEGLAPMLVTQVADLLVQIARRGVAILLVEQKLTIALNISRRVYVMGHGRVVFEGTPADLKRNESVRKEWLEV